LRADLRQRGVAVVPLLLWLGIDPGWQVMHAAHTAEWNKGDEFAPAREASEHAQ